MGDQQGRVEAIYLADAHGALPHEVSVAVAHPGRGLEGDRHFDDSGACDITLIEAEALEKLLAEHGIEYLYYGPRERAEGALSETRGLQRVYAGPEVEIFRVEPGGGT